MCGEHRQDGLSGESDVESADRSFNQNGELTVTEAEYETIFETVEDAVFVFDVEHDGDGISFSFRQNNPAHEERTDITVGEFGGDSPEEILGATEGSEVAVKYRRCVEAGETIEYEEMIDHPTGTVGWHTKLTPVFEDGEVTRIVGVSRDITEQKEREHELNQKQDRLRALFEEAPDGIVIHDADGRVLDVNETICENLRYTRDELLSMEIFDFDVSLDETASRSKWESMEPGSMQRLEMEGLHRRKDGSTFPVEVWVSKVRSSNEEPARFIALVRDITDRKEYEHELEQRETKYRNLFEGSRDALMLLDREGFFDCNEATLELFGFDSVDAFTDYTPDELSPPAQSDGMDSEVAAKKQIERAFEAGSTSFEWTHKRDDGTEFDAEVKLSRFEVDGEPAIHAIIRDITDRKKRKRELEQYERIVESASDVLWMFRDDFSEALFINEPYGEIFGQPTTTLQDDPLAFIEAVHPDDRELIRHQVERISSGGSIDFELRVNPHENFGRWVWIKGEPIYDDEGDQYAVAGFVRDITDLKEQQRQIQQFKEAIEQAAHAVYITDTEGNIQYINSAFEEITGYTEAEAMGETPSLLKSGEHDRALYEKLWRTILDGQRWHNEMIDQRKDGEQIVLDQAISPLTNEDGEVEKFVAVAKDITDRKERERQLQRHQTYLESANDMITLIDPGGTIEYVTPAVKRILGFEPEELIGENGFEYVHPKDREARIEDIEKLADSPDEETVLEFRFQRADGGYRWIESTVRNLLDDPDVESLLLSSRDITDRKEYERRLSTLHDTTRRIIDAESKQEVAEITVDAAKDLLDFSLPSVWYPTDDGTALTLVANSTEHQALLEEANTPDPTHTADSWLWGVIESDETVVKSPIPNEDLAADVPIRSAIILPLGEHGILGCGAKGEIEFSDRELRIAEILARNVRTALDQLDQRAALERQKSFTDDLLDAIEDVVYVLDTNGDFKEWNVALKEVTGYSDKEIGSMNAADFFAEEDAEAAKAAVEESFETGRTRVELDFLTADGESIPYEFIANTFEDPAGEAVMAGIGRDRSIHAEYEGALESQRDFFERTIESLPYPFYVLNADDYTIEHANSMAVVNEGETCYEVTHNRQQPCDEGDPAIACPLSDVSTSGKPETVEHVHYDEDGTERVYRVYASPIFDADGNVVQMAESNIEITERVRYEQQLEEQRDNLRVLNQVVRHDIRNDMTVIKGRANLLDEHIDPGGRDDLEAVLGATENAIALTKTARDLSETMLSTEEDVESVRLDQHLHPPIENARSKFDHAVITVEDRIPAVTVRGNELLEAVFRNLIQNAVVHNNKQIPNVAISTTVDDGTVTVVVADNGPGVPDNQKETIFGKGKKGLDSPGTGIGLYLVRTLVDQCGGSVWVEDNDPEGSVFYVELPRIDEEHRT